MNKYYDNEKTVFPSIYPVAGGFFCLLAEETCGLVQ
jgi:hypothetical protein